MIHTVGDAKINVLWQLLSLSFGMPNESKKLNFPQNWAQYSTGMCCLVNSLADSSESGTSDCGSKGPWFNPRKGPSLRIGNNITLWLM